MKLKEQILEYGLYALLILPLAFTPFTMFPWQFGKAVIFQMAIEILLVAGLSAALYSKTFLLRKLNILDKVLLFLILILLISALTGVNFNSSFWTSQMRSNGVFLYLHLGVFYFLMRNFFKTGKQWQIALDVISGVSVIVGLSAIFQNYLPLTWRGDGGNQLSGIIGNRAYLALYLILPIALSFYNFFTLAVSPNRWRRRIYFIIAFFNIGVLFFTDNRGAFVGIMAAAFFVLLLSTFILSNKCYRLIAASGLIGGCVILAVLLFIRVGSGTLDLSNYYVSGTAQTRLMAWNIAWQGFKERPILGWGMNNFEVFFNKYFNPQFLHYGFTETIWDKPHNWFLDIAYSAGAFGVMVYVGLLVCLFIYIWRLQKKATTDFNRLQYIILAGGLVAYALALFFLFEIINSILLFFVFCAFLSFLYDNQAEEKASAFINIKNWKKDLLIAGAGLIVLISLYNWNVKPIQASYYMQKSDADLLGRRDLVDWARTVDSVFNKETYLETENAILLASSIATADKMGIKIGAGGDAAQHAIERIADTLVKRAERYPDNYIYSVWAGQAYLALGTHFGVGYVDDNAVKWFKEAVKRAPQKQEAYFFLGRAYLVKKDFANSEKALREAVLLSPTLGEPYWFLGLVEIAGSKRVDGLANVEEAFRKSPGLKSIKNVLYVIDIYALENQYDKVVEYYKYLISIESKNAAWYAKLAATYVKLGDRASAKDAVEKAVALEPDLRAQADEFIKQNNLYDQKK